MSAETLREAAALMRSRAEDADPGPWDMTGPHPRPGCAVHIASWHPAVALAVADWLDAHAAYSEEYARRDGDFIDQEALAVANAYLQETP